MPPEAIEIYARQGFDFVAITDHDHLLKLNYREIIEQLQSDLLVFYGIELTVGTRFGYVHVNMIEGDKDVLYTFNHPGDYDFTLKQTIECIQEVALMYPIDAVEITHHGFYTPEFDTDLIPLPKVATDDSHTRIGCGRAWVEMDCGREKDAIIHTIKTGKFSNCYTKGQNKAVFFA
ncbi:MAG: PHP domain-containing protein [Deltaproteobacteria bacterium]|nr:PHP domain-containing protein [Deltaproteobacteria bacterium]